ncbi:hypothetical protein HYC85_030847 [Camellia sinensis]|uniref:Uncharacterized protein n=1 Tax=Camellia sinensis TaxID=4442 RepID=A0A7J7G5U9_CAMSI|nr:hypothetical protein HYC85_030847 [Camellia sinensis]
MERRSERELGDCKGILYPVKICEEQIVISKVVLQQCSCHSHQRERASQSSNNEATDEVSDSDLGNLLVRQGGDEAAKVIKACRKPKSKGMKRKVWNKKGGLELHNRIGPSAQFRKEAILRFAVAAISLSMASDSSHGRLLLNKAKATLQMGQVLGLNCEGKEEEVVSKLIELESMDLEKVHKKGKGVVS